MPKRAGTVARRVARLLAGPLALAGFFLPWTHGPGLFSYTSFSGYDLVGVTGRLQQLDLQLVPHGTVWVLRIAILGVAVAAVWHSLLAPRHRWHPCYAISGWYLVFTAGVALLIGAVRAGLVLPKPGLLLWAVGALLFVGGHLTPPAGTPRRRTWHRGRSKGICDGEGPTAKSVRS